MGAGMRRGCSVAAVTQATTLRAEQATCPEASVMVCRKAMLAPRSVSSVERTSSSSLKRAARTPDAAGRGPAPGSRGARLTGAAGPDPCLVPALAIDASTGCRGVATTGDASGRGFAGPRGIPSGAGDASGLDTRRGARDRAGAAPAGVGSGSGGLAGVGFRGTGRTGAEDQFAHCRETQGDTAASVPDFTRSGVPA